MKDNMFYSVKQSVKYWWVSLLIGILAIGLGIWALVAPGTTLAVLGALFIAGFLISGILEIIFAIANKNTINGWGWSLAVGIIDLVFAFILIAIPQGEIAGLLFFVGFWIMFQSIWGIGSSIDLQRNNVSGWGWILGLGILGLIFAFILITNPIFAAGFIIYLFAFSLLFYGIMRIYYGFRLRSIHKDIEDTEKLDY